MAVTSKNSLKEKGNNKADATEPPVLSFEKPEEWRNWLEQNHGFTPGVWLQLYKKGSGIASLNYKEALDEALCYGWIDGQLKPKDEKSFLQKFTPRRARSIWSKRNVENVARLEKEDKMQPSGRMAVEAAKADGRWERAYESAGNMTIPEDFLQALSKNKKALAFFEKLNKSNRYAIIWRLQTAKRTETRERRMKAILEMLGKEDKLY